MELIYWKKLICNKKIIKRNKKKYAAFKRLWLLKKNLKKIWLLCLFNIVVLCLFTRLGFFYKSM
jgi:hypothetical protein